MGKATLKLFLSLGLYIILFGCEKDEPNNPSEPERNYIDNCEDYASFYVNDDYMVHNNVWGFYSGGYTAPYTQCIFYDSLEPTVFGWKWDLDSISKYPSYPRIEYGLNPWVEDSFIPELPKKLNSLKSVTATFDMEFSSTGKYNTSFDIWIINSDTAKKENISAEIMIWLDANTSPNTELTIDELVIDNESYSFYKNTTWYSYPIFIYVKKVHDWDGQLNILPFLSYLSENNHLSSDSYLTDIEFGNEIWSGTGKMELMNYKIEIE